MRIIKRVLEMQQEADRWRAEGKKIALVPTMGYLHEGHLSLMRTVRDRADVVVHKNRHREMRFYDFGGGRLGRKD